VELAFEEEEEEEERRSSSHSKHIRSNPIREHEEIIRKQA